MSKTSGTRSKPAAVDTAARFVGDRLRQLREAAGLSQEGLAARSKLSAKFVGEVERAATNVSIGVLWKLVVDGLGLQMSTFFAAGDTNIADDVATLAAIVEGQPPAMRRRVLRLVRAIVDE